MDAYLQQQEKEYHFYHVEVEKQGKYWVADATHPILEKIGIYELPVQIKNNKVFMTEFDLQAITELVNLEQGRIIKKQ